MVKTMDSGTGRGMNCMQAGLTELLENYRELDAPEDQQMLIALLREVQTLSGGTLAEDTLEEIALFYGMKTILLMALIRRLNALRLSRAAHRLEMCGNCRLGAPLRAWVEETYGVRSGGVCTRSGFTYHVTPCMKNCKNGPSVRWDGELYSGADLALLERLISGVRADSRE